MPGSIQIAGDRLIYDAIHHNGTELHDPNITLPKISRDIAAHSDALQQYSSIHPKKLIVSFVNEGHSVRHAEAILPWIEQSFPDHEISFVFSCVDDTVFRKPYRCLPLSMINHKDWLSNLLSQNIDLQRIILDRKFLCLNRRPNAVRERLVWNLLNELKPHAMRVSLGCATEHYWGPGIWIGHAITIDGVISDQDKCQVTDNRFISCLFNVVTESSDQSDPNTWTSRFITEKTWKPFGLCQIPLWMAVPGMVKTVRDLGFDVFDDICDNHSYDTIQDENQRQDALVGLIRSLDQKYSILCCKRLRRQLWSRLYNNHQRLIQLKNQQTQFWYEAVNGF